ncbi:predicted protein [Uncinocarpus reesii 1704]|uniref:Ribosomal protein S21 n=1 Tax=Uncinocarpus reesii (strain UAMH 1704) TaxID=336963 RepID=C4JKL3_UNCRE|nr:uncharacterized protein UREG_02170 [Uncinocarpus reesii 1704]EEP77321.1 predicted protein [Uncinocarpus reesii 1704]
MEVRHCVNGLIKAHRIQRQCLFTSPYRSIAPSSTRAVTTSAPSKAPTGAAAASNSRSDSSNYRSFTLNPNRRSTPEANRSLPELSEVDSILRSIKTNTAARPQAAPRELSSGGDLFTREMSGMLNMFDKNFQAGADGARKPRMSSQVELRLTPSLGRTVSVDHIRGFDVAKAFVHMEARCSANKVRQDEKAQRFHVRRGQRRKELRMERWRKTFKFAFQHTVNRCLALTRQGW